MLLPDTPRPARGLPQCVKGIAGLIEVECREREEIEACLHQLGVTDHDFYAFLELLPSVGPRAPSRLQHVSGDVELPVNVAYTCTAPQARRMSSISLRSFEHTSSQIGP